MRFCPLLIASLSLLAVSCHPHTFLRHHHDDGRGRAARYDIIDVHEHIQSRQGAYKLKEAMAEENVVATVLVGSPRELVGDTAEAAQGFTDPQWNNNEILAISREHGKTFYAFGTFFPDENLLPNLKEFLNNGGTGLKLYNGHVEFHDMFGRRLDDPLMMEIFSFCEKNRVPVIFHANARLYWPELKNVLDAYPGLVVDLPHFCMALIDLEKMAYIFDNYPNVYSDVSLGYSEFAYPALEYVSGRWQSYRDFVVKYRTRFMFASDMVLGDGPEQDSRYAALMLGAYRDLLERRRYTNILIDEYLTSRNTVKTIDNGYFNGLWLDPETLRHIYEITPRRFLGID